MKNQNCSSLSHLIKWEQYIRREKIALKKLLAMMLVLAMILGLAACGAEETLDASAMAESQSAEATAHVSEAVPEEVPQQEEASLAEEPVEEPVEEVLAYEPTEEELAERTAIEEALNLDNNPNQTWTYASGSDTWTLTPVTAVVDPELPNQQGVSVCVPGAYVVGVDTNGDGEADITSADGDGAQIGALVIDYDAEITSTNGQVYTAATAPVIFTTGAAGYGSQNNSSASSSYAGDGYISMTCGNRGKQDSVKDEEGNVLYYTGDAPSCLCDQKAAARYVKYNILLGNLPGSVDHFVSTGGSGGAAHSTMFAATSNNSDFYDYQIEAGAVGVYKNSDGSYTSAVTVNGETVELSDGAWGCVSYSAITSLAEADMAQAFEYYIDTTYEFNTPFQAQLAQYLSESYMDYINSQGYSVEEGQVGFDLNKDGDLDDVIDLTIEYDPDAYPETNGYYGTYLDLYLTEFTENLQWYVDSLSYGEGWTWFDENGVAMTDDAVAAMTTEDKALAFIEGRYTKGTSGGMGMGPDGMGGPPDGLLGDLPGDLPLGLFGDGIRDGGPMAGSTASAGGGADSGNYTTFEEMAAAYHSDIAEIQAGDQYGKNIVNLYNPMNYIGTESTEDPTWTRIVMGAVEGDISMLTSLNMQIKWLASGVDAVIEWQWDGGHVPSEVLGESLALWVDKMYGEYVSGVETTKPQAESQTTNGDSEEMSGTDISGWVDYEDGKVSFALSDVLIYRNAGATKAVPGFDVIDYGQEDYVFGSDERDARHWNPYLDEIFQNTAYAEVLAPLFNGE